MMSEASIQELLLLMQRLEIPRARPHSTNHVGRVRPDDKMIATAAWDGYYKLYHGDSGKHIRDFGPTGGQNWVCDFFVDSDNLAASRGSGGPSTFVWRTDDPRSLPVTL
jgi:WD40 repeat protein